MVVALILALSAEIVPLITEVVGSMMGLLCVALHLVRSTWMHLQMVKNIDNSVRGYLSQNCDFPLLCLLIVVASL